MTQQAHDDVHHEIRRLYTEGRSIGNIAKTLRVGAARVRTVVTQDGPGRSRNEQRRLTYHLRDMARPNVHMFDAINSELSAYWSGFICADGCLAIDTKRRLSGHNEATRLTISLAIKDADHLQKFANLFDRTLLYRKRNRPQVEVNLCSLYIAEQLGIKGIIPNKTYSQELAKILDFVPSNLMQHFVRGLFDGDGCVYSGCSAPDVTIAGNISLLSQLQIVIYNTIRADSRLKMRNKYCLLQWRSFKSVLALEEWLYTDATIFLERKRNIFNEIRQYKDTNGRILITNKQRADIWNRRNNGEKLKSIAIDYGVDIGVICDTARYWDPQTRRLTPRKKRHIEKSTVKSRREKITEEQAIEIRSLNDAGAYTRQELAVMFGLSKTAIQSIVTGKAWKGARQRPSTGN